MMHFGVPSRQRDGEATACLERLEAYRLPSQADQNAARVASRVNRVMRLDPMTVGGG